MEGPTESAGAEGRKAELLTAQGTPSLALRAESQSNLDGAGGVVGEGRRDGSLLLRGIRCAYVTLSLGPSRGPAVDVVTHHSLRPAS